MEKLNDLTLNLVVRYEAFTLSLENEEGAEGIQAAGAALASAIIVGALLGGAGKVAQAVTNAMQRAASVLG